MNDLLTHGETFGQLKVLRRATDGRRWMVGCSCGKREKYSATALMRAGGHTKCSRCRKAALSCKPDDGQPQQA